jgi:hypothetical protein
MNQNLDKEEPSKKIQEELNSCKETLKTKELELSGRL